MDFNVENTAFVIAAAIIAVLQFLDRRDRRRAAEEHELAIWAAAERSRRREVKRQRRESSGPMQMPQPPLTKRDSRPMAVPEVFEDENTDMHELVELERAARKASTKHTRTGERLPRKGTHHD